MEISLNLLTAILTFISTLLSVYKDHKSEKKVARKALQIQKQRQNFHNMSTSGNNSSINITAHQTQSYFDLSALEYEKVRQENFRESFSANRFIMNIFLFVAAVLSLILAFQLLPGNVNDKMILTAIELFIVFLFSISTSMIILRLIQQFKCSNRYKPYEKSTPANMIRYLQYYLAPFLAFFTQLMLFIFTEKNFSLVQNKYPIVPWYIFILYLTFSLSSLYCCNYLINLILLYNQQQISFIKKDKKRQLQVFYKIVVLFLICLVTYELLTAFNFSLDEFN